MIEYKRLADVKNETELDYIVSEWQDRFSKAPESVENLIKLIKLRLSASKCKIKLIRETPENIRIYSPFNKVEWNIIQSKLPPQLSRVLKYTIAPATCQEGNSILLLDSRYSGFLEIYNQLTEIFTIIQKISNEYKEAQ